MKIYVVAQILGVLIIICIVVGQMIKPKPNIHKQYDQELSIKGDITDLIKDAKELWRK